MEPLRENIAATIRRHLAQLLKHGTIFTDWEGDDMAEFNATAFKSHVAGQCDELDAALESERAKGTGVGAGGMIDTLKQLVAFVREIKDLIDQHPEWVAGINAIIALVRDWLGMDPAPDNGGVV